MGAELDVAAPNVALWLVLAALPVLAVTCTAFAKSSIVLGALRKGLGADGLIPAGVVLALALVVTAIVMGPTATAIVELVDARGGPAAVVAGGADVWAVVLEPLRAFLDRHADAGELAMFAELQGLEPGHPMVLAPAFLVTELREALFIAVLILVPFVVIDLLVAQILALMGLFQQPIPLVTLPLKLLLFLSVAGWDVVIGGIVEGYL